MIAVNVLMLQRDEHKYVFYYDDAPDTETKLLAQLGLMATDKELEFSWYDAAILSKRIQGKGVR